MLIIYSLLCDREVLIVYIDENMNENNHEIIQ